MIFLNTAFDFYLRQHFDVDQGPVDGRRVLMGANDGTPDDSVPHNGVLGCGSSPAQLTRYDGVADEERVGEIRRFFRNTRD